jgi:hypothetical protein
MRHLFAILALILAVPRVVVGQAPLPSQVNDQLKEGQLTVQGTFSRVWVPRPFPDNWTSTNAIGASVMWRLALPRPDQNPSLASQFSVGLQGSTTPRESLDFGRYRVSTLGAAVEYLPFAGLPRAEPVFSLWAGALQGRLENRRLPSSIMKLPEGTTTKFSVAPSIGVRVQLLKRLGVRADYRTTVLRHTRLYQTPEVRTGASATF